MGGPRAARAQGPIVAATPTPSATNGAAPPAPPAPKALEVRLAMSPGAAQYLSELRVRGFVELELENGVLAPGTSGPPGDYVAYVWIDRPNRDQLVVEARVGDRPIVRREIATRGLDAEVAARLVAIAVTQIVRVPAQTGSRTKRTPPTRRPSPEEIERAARDRPMVVWDADAAAAWVPGDDGVVAGVRASLAFRARKASERLFGSWLAGPVAAGGALRWAEIGVGGAYHVYLSKLWRMGLGLDASLASVRVTPALAVANEAGSEDSWSARGAGHASIEWRASSNAWLTLSLEPGAILRPLHYVDGRAESRSMGGAWLGGSIGVAVETRRSP